MLPDAALDDLCLPDGRRLKQAIEDLDRRVPSERALKRAAEVWTDPSPAMVEDYARWVDLLDQVRPLLTPLQILHLAERARRGAYGGVGVAPPDELVDDVIVEAGNVARAWAETLCAEQLEAAEESPLHILAASAAALLIGTQPAARLLKLATYDTSDHALRLLIEAASPMERARWLDGFLRVAETMKRDPKDGSRYVWNRLQRALVVLDLCDPAGVAEARKAAKKDARWPELAPLLQRVLAGERYDPPRPTESAREAVAYKEAGYALARRSALLPSVAAGAGSRAVIVEDAEELCDLAAWKKAKPARRKGVLRRVAAALGGAFAVEGASIKHIASGATFVLVPGGKFRMGFSRAEEALVRRAAKENEGIENWFEEFGALLKSVGSMRPRHEVRVAPFVVSASPLSDWPLAAFLGGTLKRPWKASKARPAPAVVSIARVVDLLEKTPFRLLSEAEWEYAARGGRRRELTPFGNEVPDEAAFKVYSGKEPPNAFGLVSLGLYPEVCADALHNDQGPGYEGAPVDGSARAGAMPCVVRGGAAWLYPWQACGEWQLLCNAVRSSTTARDDQTVVRLAIGVRSP